ncbi:MAG: hypothetical protein ACRBB4_07505 [Neptuniibacter sp.]
MKSVFTKVTAVAAAVIATPALAHSEHNNMLSGFVHFMTEPDHLGVSALVATAIIFSVRKVLAKRS